MRCQAIIWTNGDILPTIHLRTRSEIWIIKVKFSFTKMHLKISSAKRRPVCFGLNMFKYRAYSTENVGPRLAVYDVKLGPKEDFANHAWTLWQCIWINRKRWYFYISYIFLVAVIFTHIESNSIVIHFNGNWLMLLVTICDISEPNFDI